MEIISELLLPIHQGATNSFLKEQKTKKEQQDQRLGLSSVMGFNEIWAFSFLQLL